MRIETRSHKHGTIFFTIDDDQYEKIKSWTLRCVENGGGQKYLQMSKVEGPIRMITYYHRFILNCNEDLVVDHINSDTTDNRLENLRIATQQENSWNRSKCRTRKCHSKYLGVTWVAAVKKWQASASHVYLGRYNDEEMAAKAYDTYARKIYGNFAKLNFPDIHEEVCFVVRQKKTSKYKGVVFDKKTAKWRACAMINGKKYTAGKCFNTEDEAAHAYNQIIIKNNGDSKRLLSI